MKKTLNIIKKILREAKAVRGASTDTETSIRQAAYQKLKGLRGSEKGAADVPRRREAAGSKGVWC